MATGYSTAEVLAAKRIMGVISRVGPGLNPLSRFLGFNIGGNNRKQFGGRRFFYDVFNRTRKVAGARAPGQQSAMIAPQKVGEVSNTFPRAAETMELLYEDVYNRRKIGGPVTELDQMGLDYITRQELYLGERFSNLIEFQTAAMLRGLYYYQQSGDTLYHSFTSTTAAKTIDFQIPSGNKNQLDMLGSGAIIGSSWLTSSTDIPTDLFQINQAMQQLSGFSLGHIFLKSGLWNAIVNNDYVVAQAGSASSPVDSISKESDGNFTAVLRALPWLTFHIVDHGLDVWNGTTETYTQLIQDDCFIGLPSAPPSEYCQYLEGSEIVVEGPGKSAPQGEQFGFYPFAYPNFDPARWDLSAVFNGIPALTVPSAVVYGDATP